MIIRHGDSVQGVNSAATLWVTAAGGMTIGVGHYRLAATLLALVLLTQLLIRRAAGWIDARAGETLPFPETTDKQQTEPDKN